MEGRPLTWLSFYTIQGFQQGRRNPTNVAIILFSTARITYQKEDATNVAIIGIWPFYTYLTWKNLSLYAGNLHHVSLPECK